MNYKIWWYWNSKTKILPAWRTHFDRHINTDKTKVSIKASFSKQVFKFFIGYKDAKKIKPLCIFLPKMIAYRKDFDETKYICFLIKDDELLDNNNEIWKKWKIVSKNNFIVKQQTIKKI